MLGALARYGILLIFSVIGPSWLPVATLVANLGGCLAIGYISQWAVQQDLTHHWWIVGVRVGLLGGLTTFSSFALDVVRQWQLGRSGLSLGLIAAHCALGIAAVALGMSLARQEPDQST